MDVIFVLSFSILMQFCAAMYSLILMRHFGGRLLWIALAAALILMTIRRSLSLIKALSLYPNHTQSLETELVALLISALVLVAVIAIRPMIESVVKSQKKLAEETQRNDIILESSPDGFCITDSSGIIEEVNPAYCQMLGKTKEQLLGTNFSSLAAPISPNFSCAAIDSIVVEGHGRYDLVQNNSAGQPVYMELIGRHVVSEEHDFVYLFLRDITERKVTEEALNQFKTTLDQTLDSVFMFCPLTLKFTYVNEGAVKHVGYDRDALLSMGPVDLKPEFNEAGFREMISPMIRGDHTSLNFETIHQCAQGKHIPVEIFLQYVQIENYDPRFVAIVRDITERHEAQAILQEQKEKAHVTLASIGDGVITTNVAGQVDFMNKAAEELCGIKHHDAKGRPLCEICTLIDEDSENEISDPIKEALQKSSPVYLSHTITLQSHNNKTIYSVEVVVSPIFDSSGVMMGAVLVLHDTTELRGMAQQLSYQATHDSLTGLINRREFEEQLKEIIAQTSKDKTEYVLFYMDLDQFKVINDTCGHMAGDEMLLHVTQLISTCMRDSDTLARLGGDEFGVVLQNCSVEKATKVADKIHKELSAFRFSWDDNVFEVGVSIGIVPINKKVISIADLLSAADSACYVAKEKGRNAQHIYVEGDKALAQHHGQMKWYQRIQRALDENRFQLYMQEIKSAQNNTPSHAEILIRMIGEKNEIISPIQFLPTAERYHMAKDIDRWVLRNVCVQLTQENSRIFMLDGICSINISGQSLGHEDFLFYVLALFEEYNVDGRQICFEITETAVISNISQAREFMTSMRQLGCKFSLDDFGSGLSSFSYLKNLDVDYLKIDGSFVRNILNDKDDYNMVSTINYLGHSLGLQTIAEFAETPELVAALEDMGVDFIQGYAIDVPSPAEATQLCEETGVLL